MRNLGKIKKGSVSLTLIALIVFFVLFHCIFGVFTYIISDIKGYYEKGFIDKVEKSFKSNISNLDNQKNLEIDRIEYDTLNFKSLLVKEENGDISLITKSNIKDSQIIRIMIKRVIEIKLNYNSNIDEYKDQYEYKNECEKGDASDCYYKIILKKQEQDKKFKF